MPVLIQPNSAHLAYSSPVTTMARLPPELMSLIFDFICKDKDWKTLKCCSLISQGYVDQVRKRLFDVISLRLRSHPNPITIRDIVRRIQGLCEFFDHNPGADKYVKTLEVLDSFPVFNSQWITQQRCLPHLLNKLRHVRHFTFGCEVGYLQWVHFEDNLQGSLLTIFDSCHLKTLDLSNIGSVPLSAFTVGAPCLCLNNVATSTTDLYADLRQWSEEEPPVPKAARPKVSFLRIRTVSMENTESAWTIMLNFADEIKLIKWRCWEDSRAADAVSLPGSIDFGKLPALKKFTIRMSYGRFGRDLLGFSQALDSISGPSNLISLDIAILFPLQANPHVVTELRTHSFWARLAEILHRPEYRSVRRVTMVLTVHEKVRFVDGVRINTVVEFRNKIKVALRPLLNMTSLHFKLKVQGFH